MQFTTRIQPICDHLQAIYCKRTGNPGLAEEVVAFAVSTCLSRWKIEDDHTLKRLMFTVAKRHFLNLKKMEKGQRWITNLDLIPERACAVSKDELADCLYQHLSKLPIRLQELIDLVYFQSQTKKKTAQLMGVSLATVKRWHNDALNNLRTALPATTAWFSS